MSINRAFAISFAIAVAFEAVLWPVDPTGLAAFIGGWLKYLPLVLLGVLLGRAGHSYVTSFANAWPFVLLWTAVGFLKVQFPSASIPPEFLAKAQSLGWWAYLLGTILGLPFAFATSAVGIWLARTLWRTDTGSNDAA